MVTWPVRLDTERRDLPTEVVPIYLLTFLHAFKQLGWQELGKRRELTPSRGFDLTTAGLLTLQHRGFCGLTCTATTSPANGI